MAEILGWTALALVVIGRTGLYRGYLGGYIAIIVGTGALGLHGAFDDNLPITILGAALFVINIHGFHILCSAIVSTTTRALQQEARNIKFDKKMDSDSDV